MSGMSGHQDLLGLVAKTVVSTNTLALGALTLGAVGDETLVQGDSVHD